MNVILCPFYSPLTHRFLSFQIRNSGEEQQSINPGQFLCLFHTKLGTLTWKELSSFPSRLVCRPLQHRVVTIYHNKVKGENIRNKFEREKSDEISGISPRRRQHSLHFFPQLFFARIPPSPFLLSWKMLPSTVPRKTLSRCQQ